jgi:hypothetical protein
MKARDNPFATDRVHAMRYVCCGEPWSALLARLRQLRYRAAIVGPHGAGKTTLLEELQAELAARGFRIKPLRLTCERPSFDPAFLDRFFHLLTPADVVTLDGAEQLTRWAWTSFRRHAACASGLIITSHRSGLLPTLTECHTSAPLLGGLIDRLLTDAMPGAIPLSGVSGDLPSAEDLFARHKGNLRAALRELYDRCAERHE